MRELTAFLPARLTRSDSLVSSSPFSACSRSRSAVRRVAFSWLLLSCFVAVALMCCSRRSDQITSCISRRSSRSASLARESVSADMLLLPPLPLPLPLPLLLGVTAGIGEGIGLVVPTGAL